MNTTAEIEPDVIVPDEISETTYLSENPLQRSEIAKRLIQLLFERHLDFKSRTAAINSIAKIAGISEAEAHQIHILVGNLSNHEG